MPNYFSKPDALVDAVRAVLTGQPVETPKKLNETNKNDKSDDGEGLDAVQPKAVKKKFKDRKDKDIDNDGDTDSSDEYLHKRRKAVSKAVKEEENPANSQHLCAKNVVHESWGEGSCVATMHADPDEEGNIEWYDVMFDHGIEEQVSIEELKVTKAEDHIHASKKTKIKESKDDDEDDDDKPKAKAKKGEDKDSSKEDEENGKKNKVSGKKDSIDTDPNMDDQRMTSEMTDSQEKKREEIVLSMKNKMPDFKKKYGDRAKDVMYATATKMAMKEGFELGIEKSNFIIEVYEATAGEAEAVKKAVRMVKSMMKVKKKTPEDAYKTWEKGTTFGPKLKAQVKQSLMSEELGEGVLRGTDYEVDEKEGVIKISKKNFAKVHKDFKGGDKSKPTMLALTKRGTSILSVQFTEELELGEAKVTKKERDRLEDQNEHGLLALKLTKAYGTPAEVKKIEAINKKHQKDGSIERKDQQERDSISNKYYKMAEEFNFDEAFSKEFNFDEAFSEAFGKLKVGDKVKKDGYPGIITKVHTGQLSGMVDVKTSGGTSTVSISDVDYVASRIKGKLGKSLAIDKKKGAYIGKMVRYDKNGKPIKEADMQEEGQE
tara:strand:+ start:2194 stop:3996 length:1803 start_codon:yes stop_codon:yes gene_type:complete